MSSFPDSPRSNSSKSVPDEDGSSGCFTEWGEDVSLYEDVDSNSEYKIISMANARVSLASIISRYGIRFEEQFNSTGWTHRCICPFPDHKDNDPSFGFNPKEDRFNCFGCNRGGKAVQFVSIMEDKPQIDVAKQIISDIPDDEDISLYVEQVDYRKIEDVLFDYADCIREFKRRNNCEPQSMKYAEAITWNLDLYLRSSVPTGLISLDSLEGRISKIKELIDCYGEPE